MAEGERAPERPQLAWGLGVLALPGLVAMVLLVLTRRRVASAPEAVPAAAARTAGTALHVRLWRSPPAPFLRFAVGTSLCTAGLVTFGLLGFHLVQARLVPTAGVPLLYAGAMAAGALAA